MNECLKHFNPLAMTQPQTLADCKLVLDELHAEVRTLEGYFSALTGQAETEPVAEA